MQPLDRTGSIPLLYQLGEAVCNKIVRGACRLDEPIPTEEQLQKFYGVSRTTVDVGSRRYLSRRWPGD
jgi:DNA-binding GntR family transcriptional regulator